jgi:endoglycosylceramidase
MRRSLLALASCAIATLTIGCSSGDPTPPGSDAGTSATVCSLSAPAPPDTRLRADGLHFRDALGRVVILRGVNASGRSKFAPFAPFDFPDGGYDAALATYLDRAQGWGLDVLRVPFTWAAVEPEQGKDDEAFLARYDALLDAAWARGMYTIVDFHQDIYAEVFCGDGFPAWTVPDPKPAPHHDCPSWSSAYFTDDGVRAAFDAFWADGSPVRAAYEAMWDRMAARYKDRPGVIGFEPINEPGWGTENLDAFEAGTLSTFFANMVTRLRKAAPDTLVFIDATGPDAGALATGLVRPPGEGVVFAPHYYQLGALAGTGGDPDKVELDLTRWKNKGAAWQSPVLVGEFGTSNEAPGTPEYMTAHFDALDALGISGTQWEYSVAQEFWNSEDLSLARPDGSETPMAASIVRAYPRAVAGDDIAFAFDAKTHGFSLRYVPSSGITEIVTPARLYPKGYDVAIQGGCADAEKPGRLLVRADDGAPLVVLEVTAR